MKKNLTVVVTDYIEDNLDWEADVLARAGIAFHARQLKGRPAEEIASKLQGADVVIVNMAKIDDALLAQLPDCRCIIRHGIGYDNVDVAACAKRNIIFAYQPEYCRDDVAEHAIALLFACARKVVRSRKTLEEAIARGQWDFSRLMPLQRLDGRTVGIAGVGRIGGLVWRKLRSFGFKFLGCDPYLSERRKRAYKSISFVDRKTLLRDSDYVTLHMPLGDETRHWIDREALELMKPTAYLINTARGGLVDVAALAEALRRKKIAGAAIDVYDKEPPPADHLLLGMENVILTPHIAWASEESAWEIRRAIVDDILAFARGKMPRHIVNKELKKSARRV